MPEDSPRQRYINALRQLQGSDGVKYDDFLNVVPHLSPEIAHREFRHSRSVIALPPLRVHHPMLSPQRLFVHRFNARTTVSHLVEWPRQSMPYSGAALDYAQQSWAGKLRPYNMLEDTVALCMQFQDPTDLERGRPKLLHEVVLAVTGQWINIVDLPQPARTAALEESIMLSSSEPLEFGELFHGQVWPVAICARCGSGLRYHDCPVCQASFNEAHGLPFEMMAPPTAIKLVQALGHQFHHRPHLPG